MPKPNNLKWFDYRNMIVDEGRASSIPRYPSEKREESDLKKSEGV
jgi:hypothetical protein